MKTPSRLKIWFDVLLIERDIEGIKFVAEIGSSEAAKGFEGAVVSCHVSG